MDLSTLSSVTCRRCGHLGCDLQLNGCGCVLHARCAPLSLVIAEQSPSAFPQTESCIPPPVTSPSMPCPICRVGHVTGIRIFPMNFDDLERAIALRKAKAATAQQDTSGQEDGSRKRSRSMEEDDMPAESSYLMLSHNNTPSSIGGRHDAHHHHHYRTGRWSNQEIAFVDTLVHGFDQGTLPIPHGVKLNDFLGDMLICKSSRLTKKMKNAKLSTRSYTLNNAPGSMNMDHSSTLSNLQESFLLSVSSEAMKLELRFHMTKLWRMHFSNLCLQVGYGFLDSEDWLASLEEMEQRASAAEQNIRTARRRRMSEALKHDDDGGAYANAGVLTEDVNMQQSPSVPSAEGIPNSDMPSKQTGLLALSDVTDDDKFLADLEAAVSDPAGRSRLFSDDYTAAFLALTDPLAMMPASTESSPDPSFGDCGSFLEQVVSFMESNNVPFQHVDLWVPSYESDGGMSATPASGAEGKLRLFHAGHTTRSDLDSTLGPQLNEFGVYSANFSFAPEVDLPGRVYAQGKPSWEKGIHEADPKLFERADKAKMYGVKTALGIPVEAPGTGRIVVAMYSTDEMDEDAMVKELCIQEISKWIPRPKWKLVIDLGTAEENAESSAATAAAETQPEPALEHYSHKPGDTTAVPEPAVARVKTEPALMHYFHKPGDTGTTAAPEPGHYSLALTAPSMTTSSTGDAKMLPVQEEVAEDKEQQIASLLGDHMPVGDGDPSLQELVPYFMSLRLLLLRSEERRSPEETEMLDIVKKSYQGYTKNNKRSGSELAFLIAKDWMYLNPSKKPASQPYQSHELSPTTETMSASGVPTNMPSPLVAHQVLPIQSNLISFSSVGSLEKAHAVTPRSRSVSASSDPSAHYAADIVPEN